MSKKLKIVAVLAIVGAVFFAFTVSPAKAQTTNLKFDSIVSALAKKLGIGQDKVQSAFDSIRSDRRAEMQKLFEERLTQAVTDKKITEAQKKLILDKHNELQKNRDTERNNRINQRQNLEDWAVKNNIDVQYLFGGYGMGRHMRGGWMVR